MLQTPGSIPLRELVYRADYVGATITPEDIDTERENTENLTDTEREDEKSTIKNNEENNGISKTTKIKETFKLWTGIGRSKTEKLKDKQNKARAKEEIARVRAEEALVKKGTEKKENLEKGIPHDHPVFRLRGGNSDPLAEEVTNITGQKKSLSKLNKSEETKKELNKVKIYIVAKSVDIDFKTTLVPISIGNFDDLSMTEFGREYSATAGAYLMSNGANIIQERDALIVDHGLQSRLLSFELAKEPSLKDLILDKTYDREGNRQYPELTVDDQSSGDLGELRLRSETRKTRTGVTGLYYYYDLDYEYSYTLLDHTIFANTQPYSTAPRDEASYNRTFKEILNNNFKDFKLDQVWDKEKKKVRFDNVEDIVFKNTTELVNKNIIPIFFNLEHAQDLLITVMEELLEPFKNTRFIEDQYNCDTYNLTNLDYLDDSFTLQNKYIMPETRLEIIKEWLVKYRFIKSNTELEKLYEDNYQEFILPYLREDLQELLDLDQQSETSYLKTSESVLLKTTKDIKIVAIGLGDFLEFWKSNEIKNGDLLFMQPTKNFDTTFLKPPTRNKPRSGALIFKRSSDAFYKYQQKFLDQNKNNRYSYRVVNYPIKK